MKKLSICILMVMLILLSACNENKKENQEIWIYTSMYKDTISELTPKLQKAFPDIKINWYQAGSEDIATKVNAEILSGNIQADILISSDRFWYEELASNNFLHSYKNSVFEKLSDQLKNPEGFYTVLSLPVMVLCYNSETINENDAPKTFKDLSDEKYKGKITTGSPLVSGTNFTTMAFLQEKYGWDYFKNLKSNEVISQGGNSSVLRRIQSSERPIGWVLLENVLRFQGKDERLKVIYPEDGIITHANVFAITKKENSRELAEKISNWFYQNDGQKSMTNSYMYSPLIDFSPPIGAPELKTILEKSMPWTKELINKIVSKRVQLKEEFTKIMFE